MNVENPAPEITLDRFSLSLSLSFSHSVLYTMPLKHI